MDTFLSLLLERAKKNPDVLALRTKQMGIWNPTSWSQARDRVSILAQALSQNGVKAGTPVGIFGPNATDFYLGYLAVHSLGGIVVPIGSNTFGEELRQQIDGADVEHVFSFEQQHVDALLECGQTCVKKIFYINGRGMENYAQPELMALSDATEGIEASTAFLEQMEEQRNPEETATILFTSGTGRSERPVELSHGALIATARSIARRETITEKDELLAYLPLSVSSDFLFSFSLALATGCTLNCPESDDTVLENMQEIGPSILFGPSYVYKYIYTHASNRIESARSFDTKIYKAALRAVMTVASHRAAGQKGSFADWLLFMFARITTFSPFCNIYGLTRLRLALTGGDAIASDVFNFFRAIGIDLRETYGQVEGCACVTMQSSEDWNSDSVGLPLDGTEVRIENGEIWFRGPGQMKGIYKNPEATADSIKDGWVRTHDAGHLDDQGRLHVHGQIARMGTLNGGGAFAPDMLETRLRSFEYIKQAIVIGNGRDYPVAVVTVDGTITRTWADRRSLRYTGYADLSAHASVQEMVREYIQKVNESLAEDPETSGMQFRRFAILNREFMASAGEVTPTRKLRCHEVEEKHRGLIDALYSDALEYTYTDPVDEESYTVPLGNV